MSKTRIINLNGTIDEINAINVIVKLLDLDSESHEEPIQIYINSNGGSIVHGLAIYDTMKHIQAPVYTTCTGLCGSILTKLWRKRTSCCFKTQSYPYPPTINQL